MSEYKIITDSTTDLSESLVNELELHVISLTYTIDGRDYVNSISNPTLSARDFYEQLRAGKMATTSQVNVDAFMTEFKPFLEQGLDILYISFSSGLSSTCSSAQIAANDLREEFPERKVLVVDSLAASMGEGLLVYHAVMKKREGLDIDELAKWVEDNRLNLAHWFTVEDLNFLKRGGRVSSAAALIGTMLNIKPVLHVDDEGHLIPVEKVRGRRKSLEALVEHMEKTAINPAEQVVFISHGDAPEDAQYVANLIEQKFGTKTFYITPIGPVIGSHSGPGTIALFFLAEKRL